MWVACAGAGLTLRLTPALPRLLTCARTAHASRRRPRTCNTAGKRGEAAQSQRETPSTPRLLPPNDKRAMPRLTLLPNAPPPLTCTEVARVVMRSPLYLSMLALTVRGTGRLHGDTKHPQQGAVPTGEALRRRDDSPPRGLASRVPGPQGSLQVGRHLHVAAHAQLGVHGGCARMSPRTMHHKATCETPGAAPPASAFGSGGRRSPTHAARRRPPPPGWPPWRARCSPWART